jgi:hypothetical protein
MCPIDSPLICRTHHGPCPLTRSFFSQAEPRVYREIGFLILRRHPRVPHPLVDFPSHGAVLMAYEKHHVCAPKVWMERLRNDW